MNETAIREMDIYAWLSVAACGYALDRRQRARVSHFGRHVLAECGDIFATGTMADKQEYAGIMIADGAKCVADDVPHEAVAGMLVKCLKRVDPKAGDEWLGRLNEQATRYYEGAT